MISPIGHTRWETRSWWSSNRTPYFHKPATGGPKRLASTQPCSMNHPSDVLRVGEVSMCHIKYRRHPDNFELYSPAFEMCFIWMCGDLPLSYRQHEAEFSVNLLKNKKKKILSKKATTDGLNLLISAPLRLKVCLDTHSLEPFPLNSLPKSQVFHPRLRALSSL